MGLPRRREMRPKGGVVPAGQSRVPPRHPAQADAQGVGQFKGGVGIHDQDVVALLGNGSRITAQDTVAFAVWSPQPTTRVAPEPAAR